MPALETERRRFEPSGQLAKPHAMVGVNVIAADTDDEARRLFTSAQQAFTNMQRGTRGLLPRPIDDIETYWSPVEKARASAMLARSFVARADTVRPGLAPCLSQTGPQQHYVTTDERRRGKEVDMTSYTGSAPETKQKKQYS